MKIFLAGATGAVGRRLIPMLVGAGHAVTGIRGTRIRRRRLPRPGPHHLLSTPSIPGYSWRLCGK